MTPGGAEVGQLGGDIAVAFTLWREGGRGSPIGST
jgi:hypothetical protein